MKQEDKAEIFNQINQLHRQLVEIGIAPGSIGQVMLFMEKYAALQTKLTIYRQEQFHEDAHDLNYRVSMAARGEKDDEAAKYLREFAEHIANHATIAENGDIAGLVDTIPTLSEYQLQLAKDTAESKQIEVE